MCCFTLRTAVTVLASLALLSSLGLFQVCYIGGTIGVVCSMMGLNGCLHSKARHVLVFFVFKCMTAVMTVYHMSVQMGAMDPAQVCESAAETSDGVNVAQCLQIIKPAMSLAVLFSTLVMTYLVTLVWRFYIELRTPALVLEITPEVAATTVYIDEMPAAKDVNVTYAPVAARTVPAQIAQDEELARRLQEEDDMA